MRIAMLLREPTNRSMQPTTAAAHTHSRCLLHIKRNLNQWIFYVDAHRGRLFDIKESHSLCCPLLYLLFSLFFLSLPSCLFVCKISPWILDSIQTFPSFSSSYLSRCRTHGCISLIQKRLEQLIVYIENTHLRRSFSIEQHQLLVRKREKKGIFIRRQMYRQKLIWLLCLERLLQTNRKKKLAYRSSSTHSSLYFGSQDSFPISKLLFHTLGWYKVFICCLLLVFFPSFRS